MDLFFSLINLKLLFLSNAVTQIRTLILTYLCMCISNDYYNFLSKQKIICKYNFWLPLSMHLQNDDKNDKQPGLIVAILNLSSYFSG